jgi:hypothetical protein
MTFPKIETLYGMYARGKFPGLPRGLNYQEVYEEVSEGIARMLKSSERRRRGTESPFQMGNLPLMDEDRMRLTVLRLESAEVYWLLFGRTEFRLSHGFMSRAVHMGPEFPVSALLQKEKRRVARLTWPKGTLCCGLACAYVEIIDISAMDEENRASAIKLYGPHEVQIAVAECSGYDPIVSPPHPRVVFVGNLDESLLLILARRVLGDLVSVDCPPTESMLDEIGDRYEDHRSEIQHSLSLAAVAAISFLLLDQNHRFVRKVSPLVTPRRRGNPSEPVPYLVGDGLSVLPKDRDLVNVGAVTWEQFEGGDGQVLFHWPSLIEGQVETPPESPNILENDGG